MRSRADTTPNYDLIYDIFVWFVGLFTKDTGTVFNLYVLVIPFATRWRGTRCSAWSGCAAG